MAAWKSISGSEVSMALVIFCAQWTNPQAQWPMKTTIIYITHIYICNHLSYSLMFVMWPGVNGAGCVSPMRYPLQWVSGVQMGLKVHSRGGKWELGFSPGQFWLPHSTMACLKAEHPKKGKARQKQHFPLWLGIRSHKWHFRHTLLIKSVTKVHLFLSGEVSVVSESL